MAKIHRTSDLSALTVADLTKQLDGQHSAPLAHNTRVERDDDGSIGVRFHATRILTFHADGSFTVSTGGWRTVTTKQRLNALLPAGYRIFSREYVWYLSTPEGTHEFCDGDRWRAPTHARPTPRFQRGDRVISFRGEHATVTHVLPARYAHQSHKYLMAWEDTGSHAGPYYEGVFTLAAA